MPKYVIKNIQRGITASGRFPDTINAEVEFQDESGKPIFISMMEMKGYPSVFKTDKGMFLKFMNRGAESKEAADKIPYDELFDLYRDFIQEIFKNYTIFSFDSYNEFYDDKDCGGDLREAIRFVIYVTRATREEFELCKQEYMGKAIGDFEIPKCNVELAWEQGMTSNNSAEYSLQ